MKQFQKGLFETRTLIIPFGSVEEHGCHLPLGTDTIHVYELARRVAEIKPVFVAPPIWYGLCRSTKLHPGTIGIDSYTLKLLTQDICRSFYRQGLRNFILISGHAGGTHMASILDAADTLLEELEESKFAVLSILDLVGKIPKDIVITHGDSHAGEVETSIMLFLRPNDVDGTSPKEFPTFPQFFLVRNKRKFWKGGVWGNPEVASAEKGAEILKLEAKYLAHIIEELENFID